MPYTSAGVWSGNPGCPGRRAWTGPAKRLIHIARQPRGLAAERAYTSAKGIDIDPTVYRPAGFDPVFEPAHVVDLAVAHFLESLAGQRGATYNPNTGVAVKGDVSDPEAWVRAVDEPVELGRGVPEMGHQLLAGKTVLVRTALDGLAVREGGGLVAGMESGVFEIDLPAGDARARTARSNRR